MTDSMSPLRKRQVTPRYVRSVVKKRQAAEAAADTAKKQKQEADKAINSILYSVTEKTGHGAETAVGSLEGDLMAVEGRMELTVQSQVDHASKSG